MVLFPKQSTNSRLNTSAENGSVLNEIKQFIYWRMHNCFQPKEPSHTTLLPKLMKRLILSPDGTQYAALSKNEICILNTQTGTIENTIPLPVNKEGIQPTICTHPNWSSNGKQLSIGVLPLVGKAYRLLGFNSETGGAIFDITKEGEDLARNPNDYLDHVIVDDNTIAVARSRFSNRHFECAITIHELDTNSTYDLKSGTPASIFGSESEADPLAYQIEFPHVAFSPLSFGSNFNIHSSYSDEKLSRAPGSEHSVSYNDGLFIIKPTTKEEVVQYIRIHKRTTYANQAHEIAVSKKGTIAARYRNGRIYVWHHAAKRRSEIAVEKASEQIDPYTESFAPKEEVVHMFFLGNGTLVTRSKNNTLSHWTVE